MPISIEMSPASERYLQQLAARGIYRNYAAAIDEAAELLKRRDQLRALVLSGIRQADRGELLDADEVFARPMKRAQQIEASARGTA